jgi:hypothetical protein
MKIGYNCRRSKEEEERGEMLSAVLDLVDVDEVERISP